MKSATGLTGSGSRDWFIQRVSAVVSCCLYRCGIWLDSSVTVDSTLNSGTAL